MDANTFVRDLGGELLFDTDLETRPVLIEQRGDGWSATLSPAPATPGGACRAGVDKK